MPPSANFSAFTYRIVRNSDRKYYIGYKLIHVLDAPKYTSSSKELQDDIKTLGVECFSFEILYFHRTRSEAQAAEVILQLGLGIGESNNSYNKAIGSMKFMTPNIMDETETTLLEDCHICGGIHSRHISC